MTELSKPLGPLVDVKGYEFRPYSPERAEAIVDVFFGKGHSALHDAYDVGVDKLTLVSRGVINELTANGKMESLDWNDDQTGGFIHLGKGPVFAVTAEDNNAILMIGEQEDGKIMRIHRFWKASEEVLANDGL